ncbi:MAG: siderophore-interacting protein [Aldersonia sp.]|nr:siderophore-interacting protein [Aldersonia sp.]
MAKRRTTLTVLGSEWVNSNMVRVRLGGAGFDDFVPSEYTDSYVKIVFPQGDGSAAESIGRSAGSAPDSIGRSAGSAPAEVLRTYTVRYVDPQAREIAIDFVVHGDEGIAGPWARSVQPGTQVSVLGPGGAYAPRTDADWHLFAGDEAALPAISAALEALPADAKGQAFIEVNGSDGEIALRKPERVTITWLHRNGDHSSHRDGAESPLSNAVRSAEWLPGQVHVFIHGEAHTVMQDLRRYVRRERGVPAEWASISGYWRRGRTEEGFRVWKKELAAAEAVG